MKVLVINGSPKAPEKSNTMRLTKAVLAGLKESNPQAEILSLNVNDLDIHHCMGCLSCWGEHQGTCIFHDDMEMVHREFMAADLVIYSFPLYFFGMPAPMKNLQDRLVPLVKTYKGEIREFGTDAFHDFRFDASGKKFLVISTCGYGRTYEIFDSLIAELNLIFGGDNYRALLCPQGEMFSVEALEPRIKDYLVRYQEIGRTLGQGQDLTDEMVAKTAEPILDQRLFEALAKRHWNQFDKKEDA